MSIRVCWSRKVWSCRTSTSSRSYALQQNLLGTASIEPTTILSASIEHKQSEWMQMKPIIIVIYIHGSLLRIPVFPALIALGRSKIDVVARITSSVCAPIVIMTFQWFGGKGILSILLFYYWLVIVSLRFIRFSFHIIRMSSFLFGFSLHYSPSK